jgi:hypothetical protein
MTTNVLCVRQHGAWQFSLKSLMFVTMVVAICAALVHISLALAVVLIPLIAAGLVRTIRVVTRTEATGDREAVPGLFATFCRSIALIIAMIGVGVAAISFAGVTAVLIAVMVVIHVFRATGILYHPIMNRTRLGSIKLARWTWKTLTRIKPVGILRWIQAYAVAGTLSLFGICRRLWQQWWCYKPSAAPVTGASHARRTDPL